jgi:hypothetical protein
MILRWLIPQGSAFRATLGWMILSRWDKSGLKKPDLRD